MTQGKNEDEKKKTKSGLFDYIFESSIKSSKTVAYIVDELLFLSKEINSIRIAMVELSKVIQIHQTAIQDIYKLMEQTAKASKKNNDVAIFPIDNKKENKPN